MAWTLCVSGLAILRAGTHADTTGILSSPIDFDLMSDAVEGRICADGHSDFVTDYSTFTGKIQQALSDVCSSLIAMDIIAFNTTGYLRREADTLMNLNDDRATKGMAILTNKTGQKLT